MPENQYFQGNPTRLDISRSKMSFKPRWTGTWDTGKLVPIFATSLIQPGDSVRMDVSAAIRSITPVFPVMDDMDITIEAFFVPHRLILSRKSMSPDVNDSNHSWAAFLGAQDSLLNMPTPGDVDLPYMGVAYDGYKVGQLADCLGMPKPSDSNGSYKVNCLKPLAYYSVWNEYFREPSTMSSVTYTISSGQVILTGSDAYLSSVGNVSSCYLAPVSRYHGYFGSALPWPQRNTTQVSLPLGVKAPVVVGDNHLNAGDSSGKIQFVPVYEQDLKVKNALEGHTFFLTNPSGQPQIRYAYLSDESGTVGVNTSYGVAPRNLWTDLSTATAASVNELRLAIQTQRWYEALARGGNKLDDLTYSMFGVRGPSVTNRPEYLGGVRVPISVSQVNATAGDVADGDSFTPGAATLGATGAFSLTNLNNFLFSKSFTEHGTLIVVACCRVHDSFAQGVSCEDTKFSRFDYFWPAFANLGEKIVYGRELFVDGKSSGSHDKDVFGYQEAWAEYRYIPDRVTGHCRPGQDLEMITYCNNFSSLPTLKSFLDASSQVDNVDKTLQYSHSAAGFQFYGQFQFNMTMVRPMPLYSIPGLMDHH